MNKELKKLKTLAEKYFYCGKKLTTKERFLLENSPFADLLRNDTSNTEFSKVLEQYGEANNVQVTEPVRNGSVAPKGYKKRYLNISVHRQYLAALIDDVEEEFNLGAFNKSLYKFDNVDVNRLKQFIDYHCKRNMIDKAYPGTCKAISSAIDSYDDVHDVMYGLYSLQR
jgi:hypothetical protein